MEIDKVIHNLPSSSEEHVKMFFLLDYGDYGFSSESMWVVPLANGLFEVRNIPFFVFGISYGDVVSAKIGKYGDLEYLSTISKSGNSTYRLIFIIKIDEVMKNKVWKSLIYIGCSYEGYNDKYISMNIPNYVEIYTVYSLLENGASIGLWEFEEAHVGHVL